MRHRMQIFIAIVFGLLLFGTARAGATFVQTPYAAPKVVFDFFLDDPAKMGAALYWIRALALALSEEPYEFNPETVKVVIHGTEVVTLAKKNEERYKDDVERMRYYADLGVEFKVCVVAMDDYGYNLEGMQDFVQVVPSGPAELVHWQHQGYAVITPQIMDKKFSIESIR
ncbi:MAG TPA: DsrE family protein [Thiobacillaceae bacterium]|nr:DsrE family protein [Thiobacillaceae bacterium]HNU63128.1 DsrE family protein [Thiobacillaceae bacterium]